MHLMETHFNIQRRLFDYQFSLTTTPPSWNRCTKSSSEPITRRPIRACSRSTLPHPFRSEVLGEAKGRVRTPDELERKFAHALFPRTTKRYGCVTLHSYHFYVEQGLPRTQVLLWVYGQALRAVFDNVVLAEYHCPLRSARAQSHRHPRWELSSHALCLVSGLADTLESSRILGALSSYADEASGTAAFSCPAIMALRTCPHSVEEGTAWRQIS